jgi:hypothetical protein
MKNMCADVLNGTLSMQWIKMDGGLALRTSQRNMFHIGFIGVEFLHDKACSPW